jgi:hypothetical protein
MFLAVVVAAAMAAGADDPWVEPMRKVHAKFTGQSGTVAQFGDSITITMAFFVPLQYGIRNVPADVKPAHDWIRGYVQGRCWRGWKGPQFGNEGRTTTAWAMQHMDEWLERLNPEVAIIMWGTNDTYRGPRPPKYTDNLRAIVQKCLDNGTVPILNTIPPKGGQARNEKERVLVESFVDAARTVAKEKQIPLIDFYKEMLDRQPKDFATTLLGDNLHPSYPQEHRQSFSEESLRQSGYTLRNYLTLRKYYEVYEKVLSKVKSKRAAASEAAWTGPVFRERPAVVIPRVDAAPTINGRADEPCWNKAQSLPFRRLDGSPEKLKHATSAKLVATDKALYIAFHCADANTDRLVARKRDHDTNVWEDDSVELFLRAGPEPARDYCHLIVNPVGSFRDAKGQDAGAWDPAVQIATHKAAGHWSVEVGIAFAEMGLPADKAVLAGPWRLNLARMRPPRGDEPVEEGALSPTEDPSSHVPDRFGYAFFEVFGGKLPKETAAKAP